MAIISDEQIVSLHTIGGVQLDQFLGNSHVGLQWSREQREISTLTMTVPSTLDVRRGLTIQPWLHWISVWNDQGTELYWTGPIDRVRANRRDMVITAADVSVLAGATRCPLTKQWDAADPATIAGELWEAMVRHHGVETRPIQKLDPRGDPFDFTAVADEELMDETIGRLVDLGLYWTVVAGVPILGPAGLKPFVELGEHDFVGDGFALVRDGRESFNDVLVRGADNLARASVPMAGLRRQTIVNVDSMFGVSNVDRAAHQYVRYTGMVKDTVVADSAVLHPDAPLRIEQLIPSARVIVDQYGLLTQMEIMSVNVEAGSVSLRLQQIDDDLPELVEINGGPGGVQ
ncbi:hypothetical protein [Mycolicibacterium sp.]|uniref:hypothetical protein n=1 Tax=Mycolicibacterium sp. TaxID=2320850 RepID=UPI00355E3A1D